MPHSSNSLCLLALTLAACTTAPHPYRTVRSGLPGSAVGFSRPPVVDGSRAPCLAPPYTPGLAATTLADGTPVHGDHDGRRWTVSLAGEARPSAAEASALIERLRARGGALRWVSFGVYCGEHDDVLCLSYGGNLCETNVDEVVTEIRAAIAADSVLPHPQIDLAVTLAGALGPRCVATDPACLPLAYEGGEYDPHGERHAGPLATHSAGACTQDGDCVQAGCGNHCLSWEFGGAHEAATCEGYIFDEPVFCGCVEGACAWFSQ